MPRPVIVLRDVTKTYGSSRGVENISLSVDTGSVFGFLGPNGAGKTTTISMLADLIRPTKGSIKIFGQDSVKDSVDIRKRIGFLAGDFALDRGLTGWQQLEFFGSLRGRFEKRKVRALAERLECDLDRKFKTLSRGNKQKVGLISALMHGPELLIFDEPTSGLDPLIQAEFNKIILENKKNGQTTFISSHVLSEIQEICDRVAFIKEGKIIAVEDVKDLVAKSPKIIKIRTDDKKLRQAAAGLSGVAILQGSGPVLEFTYTGDIRQLLKLLAGAHIGNLTIEDADLETIFMKYYEADYA